MKKILVFCIVLTVLVVAEALYATYCAPPAKTDPTEVGDTSNATATPMRRAAY
jgi:hypothetical protein